MKTPPLLFIISLIFMLLNTSSSFAQVQTDKNLQKKLQSALKDFKGTAGIYVYNLKTKKEAGINADTIFPTASIVKIPILVGVFKKIIDGELNYHEPLMYRDSMAYGGSGVMQYFKDSTKVDLSVPVSLMISRSDNTGSLWSQKLAGDGKTINTWLKKHNYEHTRVNSGDNTRKKEHKKYGWGQTTPREMAHLLKLIREKSILTPAACERMYRNLTNIYWDDMALSQIPPEVQTASKQGMVNASRSEAVLVNAPHGDYVFYIATKDNEDIRWKPDNEAWQLARDVSKLLWNYFEPDFGWKPAKNSSQFYNWDGDDEDY